MAFNEKILEVKDLLNQVNELLAAQKTALDATSESIKNYAKNAKVPSDFTNAQKQIKDQETVRAELQKSLDANAAAVSKKQAQMNAAFAAAEAQRAKDLASQQAKTAKEIELYEKAAQKEIELNNKRVASEQKKAERLIEIEQNKAAKIIAANEKLAAKLAAIDAKNSRTGASSTIPGMGAKIADVKNAERAALANEKLGRAYVKLSNDLKIVKDRLQDYTIAFGKNNQMTRAAQREYDILSKRIGEADKAVGKFSSTSSSFKSLSSGIGSLMGAFGIGTGLYLAVDIFKDIYKTTKELQSLDLALKMVSGTELELQTNQIFLADISQKWGLEVKALTQQYTMFYTASKDLLSTKDIKTTFEGIAKAGSVMGLSLDKQSAAFYAIDQMMSKGTVTAEELKKQLGNAMPGAIKAAAMAYMDLHPAITSIQVAEKELYAAMKQGALDSATYVPLIVKNLNKIYGTEQLERVDTLIAAQNRLSNSWTNLIRRSTEGQSIFGEVIKDFMDGLSWWLDNAEKVIKYTGLLGFAITKIYETINATDIARDKNKERRAAAIKQAVDDANHLTDAEKKLTLQLSLKRAELQKLESASLTATGDDSSKIQNRIESAKAEIAVLEAQLKQEEMLFEVRRKARLADTYDKAKSLSSETNAILLENIELLEKKKDLEQILKQRSDVGRAKELDEVNKLLGKNGIQLTKNNDLMSYYNTLIGELKSTAAKTTPDDKETEKEKKARLAREKKEAQAEEQRRKDAYDLDISNIQRKIEIAKDEYKIVSELHKNEIGYIEGGVAKKMALSMKLATFELELAQRVAKEKKRLAQGNTKLGIDPTIGGDTIAQNEYNTEAENVAQEHVDRMDKINKDYFKAMEEAVPKDWSSKTPTMWTKEQIKQAEEDQKKIKEIQDKIKDDIAKYIESFQKTFAGDLGLEKTFDMFVKLQENGKTMWQNINDLAEGSKEKQIAIFEAISESAQEAFNFMSQASQENFDAEYDRLERKKEDALRFAGESESGRAEIERQYERKRQQIARREAKAKKDTALFNIFVDTAQAVAAFLAKGQWGQAIAAGILGGIQYAMVSSKDVPNYFTGTDSAPEGVAWTQEKGQEIITDKSGKVKDMGDNKGPRLTYLKQGDKVIKNRDTLDILSFNRSYANLMDSTGISGPIINVEGGGINSERFDEGISRLEKVIKDKPSFQLIDDERGRRLYREYRGERTQLMNDRQNIISRDV